MFAKRCLRLISKYCEYKRKIYNHFVNTTMKEDNTHPEVHIEGKAQIYTKYIEKDTEGHKIQKEVFYNPVQVFNRDLSVLAMQGFINRIQQERGNKFQGATIVDALSASGLRTVRYLKQLKGVSKVIANDILPAAHKLMQDNFDLNKLDPLTYERSLKDANVLLRQGPQRGFDIVDLDPYGSVVPFLDSAVGAVRDGGLLCITCTDTRVLCGPDMTKCFYYYGSVRARVHDFNENALRILLFTVSAAAGRHCKYIEPLLSLQTDFYVRVFVRVFAGKKECGLSSTKIGNIHNCQFCGHYEGQSFFRLKQKGQPSPQRQLSGSICPVCSHPLQLNGPIWMDRINDNGFVDELNKLLEEGLELTTNKKIKGVLHCIKQEGDMSLRPLGFNLDLACKTIHSTGMGKQVLLDAVKSLGENNTITPSYLTPGLFKTNLPMKAIYDILKSWKKKQMEQDKYLNNVKADNATNILKAPVTYHPDFQYKSDLKFEQIPRFISLGKGLGPKGKPGQRVLQEEEEEQNVQVKNEQPKNKGEKKGKPSKN